MEKVHINKNQNSHILTCKRPVALVTGGAVRIGRAISLELAKNFTVAVHYNTSSIPAENLISEIVQQNGQATAFQSDLTSPGSPKRLIQQVVSQLGHLDILVNNAAFFADDTADILTLAKMKLLNVDAPKHLIEEATPHLIKTQGAVVNISDIAGIRGYSRYKAYSKTKAALNKLTQITALQLAKQNVRINSVCPGTVLFAEEFSKDARQQVIANIPFRRSGTPTDVAELVSYLASATYVTGQIIAVDGGRLLNPDQ